MESTTPTEQVPSIPAERALSVACTQLQQPASQELVQLRAENVRLKKELRKLATRNNELHFRLVEEHTFSANEIQKMAVMRVKLKAAQASLHNLAAMATEHGACLERGGLLDSR
mgnify:CR=1 FL=1